MALKTKIGKSTLSAFLRTNCDRELYFSLFRSNTPDRLVKGGMPAPLSGRANLNLLADAGIEFEHQEYAMLKKLVGEEHLRFSEDEKGNYADLDLSSALAGAPVPGFCLQPHIDPQVFRKSFLCDDLQLTSQQEKIIPELTGMRPDLIITRQRAGLLWEVMPNGRRKMLDEHDNRVALSVVDIKSAAEGNRSYAAEVVLYAVRRGIIS